MTRAEAVPEPRPLTKAQHVAIGRVERALDAADRAGVAFCGMDSRLYAYRKDDFDRLAQELPSAYEVQRALTDDPITSISIDSPAYRESGGW